MPDLDKDDKNSEKPGEPTQEFEIEEFQREKEKIRTLIGHIGGKKFSRRDNVINAIFLAVILILFVMEITTHWLPSFISLELSVLLVSIKIVWMMHSQHQYNHFVFWILNSIEFRVNDGSKKMSKIVKLCEELGKENST